MISLRDASAAGEIAVIGLGKSGLAVVELLTRLGARVYGSDRAQGEGHDLARIARASLAVVSPGVPPDAPPVVAARQAGVPLVSEIEVALAYQPRLRYAAVTGTNGKTTTTALIAHLFAALGYDAVAAGNIGTPLAEVVLRERLPAWVALELSSFQLHDTPSVAPQVGVLTNLSPDHLDRYASVEAYYADKGLLYRNAAAASIWVTNGDDTTALALAAPAPGRHPRFSLVDQTADAAYDGANQRLTLFGDTLLARTDLPLIGEHNVANALAASLAVALGDDANHPQSAVRAMAQGLREFHALAHRLQVVGEFNGVVWIDDSKATNVSSSLVAIRGMTRPSVVLLGGRHKGEPYSALAEPLRRVARAVIAYGEAAPIVEGDLRDAVRDTVTFERMGSDFQEVIHRARALAMPGDAVLLSPACSSFDMFRNYEDRGATFARLAAVA